MKHTLRSVHASILVLTLAAVLAPRAAAADPMTLQWDFNPEPDVTGYIVYVGTQSGVYSQSFDVGNTNSFVYAAAAAGQRYYFAVAAYAGLLVSELSVEVSGEAGGSVSSNAAPYLLSPGNQTSYIGQGVSLQLVGGDSQGEPVTYSASGLPPGLTVGQMSGLIVGVPTTAGSYSVTARVSDGAQSVQRGFTWSVLQATSSPTTGPSISSTPSTGTSTASTSSSDAVRSIRQLGDGSTFTGTRAMVRPLDGSAETITTRSPTGTNALVRPGSTSTGSTTTAAGTYTGTTAVTRASTTGSATGATSMPTLAYTGTTAAVRSTASAPPVGADSYSGADLGPYPTSPTATSTSTGGSGTTTTLSAPQVRIQTPTDSSSFTAGTPIILAAVAEDVEDGTITSRIIWSSSLDGPLGTGGLVYRVLTNGVHVVTALVSDRHGNVRTSRVTVVVGQ